MIDLKFNGISLSLDSVFGFRVESHAGSTVAADLRTSSNGISLAEKSIGIGDIDFDGDVLGENGGVSVGVFREEIIVIGEIDSFCGIEVHRAEIVDAIFDPVVAVIVVPVGSVVGVVELVVKLGD